MHALVSEPFTHRVREYLHEVAMPGGARQRSKQPMASAKQHMRHRASPDVYCISASSESWAGFRMRKMTRRTSLPTD